jgi:hypothetical protein
MVSCCGFSPCSEAVMVYKVLMVQGFSDSFKFFVPLASHLFSTRYTATMEPERDMWDIFYVLSDTLKWF